MAGNDQQDLQPWLPKPQQPIGYVTVDGQRMAVRIDEQGWFKFFYFVSELRLGGVSGTPLPDLEAAVVAAAAAAAAAATTATASQVNVDALAQVLIDVSNQIVAALK